MRLRVREQALPRPQIAVQVALMTMFAALTAASAQVRLHLPFTPVPVTGQVFAVLLAGAVLGPRLGLLSQLEYLAAGAAGLPVFAYGGGALALLGPTSGYLVAFPLAAWAVGTLVARLHSWGTVGASLACFAGVLVINAFGAGWYSVWALSVGQALGLPSVITHSLYAFLAVDAVKALAAASLAQPVRARLLGG
jgi:biotin transport system substrate-specific component